LTSSISLCTCIGSLSGAYMRTCTRLRRTRSRSSARQAMAMAAHQWQQVNLRIPRQCTRSHGRKSTAFDMDTEDLFRKECLKQVAFLDEAPRLDRQDQQTTIKITTQVSSSSSSMSCSQPLQDVFKALTSGDSATRQSEYLRHKELESSKFQATNQTKAALLMCYFIGLLSCLHSAGLYLGLPKFHSTKSHSRPNFIQLSSNPCCTRLLMFNLLS